MDIMVDIEALDSNAETAAIVSVGAIKFDLAKGELGETFYIEIADHGLKDQLGRGRTMSFDTMCWWLAQSDDARKVLLPPNLAAGDSQRVNTPAFLDAFRVYCQGTTGVWGNGVTYDNVAIRSLYKTYSQTCPWYWSKDRCYRSYKAVHGNSAMLVREGTHHNALADAITQAKHLIAMYQNVTKGRK